MATANKYLKGQDVNVYFEGTKIAASTSCTISYTIDTEDVSSKDDDQFYFDAQEPKSLGWSIQNESYVPEANGFCTLLNAAISREKVLVDAYNAGGQVSISGYAHISSLSLNATVDGFATISLTLDGDGSDLIDNK